MKLSRFFDRRIKNVLFSGIFLLIFFNSAKATEPPNSSSSQESAKFQGNLGVYYWQKGDWHQAIDAWAKEAEIYRQQGLEDAETEVVLKIAQGYISLGQFRLAIFQLKQLLRADNNPAITAQIWEKLGNAYSRMSKLDEAFLAYKRSQESEESLSTLNNFVRLLQKQVLYAELQSNSSSKDEENQRYLQKAREYNSLARDYAKQALSLSQDQQSSSAVRALIEWYKLSPTQLSVEELNRGRRLLANLDSSRTKVFLAINWAKLDETQVEYWLLQAVDVAQNIGDEFAESYALLELGLLAEKSGNFPQALEYANYAQLKAQSQSAYRSLYESKWLAGRIYRSIGKKEAAILSFRDAVAALDAFNQGLTTISVERRIDFSLKIEPIYRGLLELLLDDNLDLSEANLQEALLVSSKLRLAQLQNYFGDNCFDIKGSIKSTLTSQNAVSVNSIILEDRTYFILQVPDGTLHYSKSELGKSEINKLATDWYESIKDESNWQYGRKAIDLYNIIIRPFEQKLAATNPTTVIFIHDGVLRNIPMAALYDGDKFLIEKWAVVSSLSLEFKEKAEREQVSKVAAFGLGVAREGWSALEGVSEEVESVIDIMGGKKFLDKNFTVANFAEQLNQKNYSVLHLASHAYFGGIVENSSILAYDRPISALDLNNYLSQSNSAIVLLVLSACETALGSDYSILGLSGIALRSGVDSVLGTLWEVQDDSQVPLIEDFYSKIREPNFNRASALQQIQIEQIQLQYHPSKWAALNLIGEPN